MNNNFVSNPTQESPAQLRYGLYNLFSKGVFLVVGISSVITAFFLLCKTIVTAVTAMPEDILQALYYFFGKGSIPFVNLIVGLLAVLFFGMLSLSMFRLYSDAKRTASAPTPQSFIPLIVSLVFFIILAIIIAIIAFASLSVISYQNSVFLDTNEPMNLYDNHNVTMFFVPYVLFTTAAILIGIGLIRLTVSMKKTVSLTNISHAGIVISMIGLISGAFLCTCNFMSNLSLFLMPSYLMSNSHTLNSTLLISLMLSTLISASVTVMLIAAAVIVARYNDTLYKVFHYKNNPYIAQYATNVASQEPNRKPMPQPAEYQPIERYGYQPYRPTPMPTQKFPQAPQNSNQQFISQPYNQYSVTQQSFEPAKAEQATSEQLPINLTKESTDSEKTTTE